MPTPIKAGQIIRFIESSDMMEDWSLLQALRAFDLDEYRDAAQAMAASANDPSHLALHRLVSRLIADGMVGECDDVIDVYHSESLLAKWVEESVTRYNTHKPRMIVPGSTKLTMDGRTLMDNGQGMMVDKVTGEPMGWIEYQTGRYIPMC